MRFLKLVIFLFCIHFSNSAFSQKLQYFDSDFNQVNKRKFIRKLNNHKHHLDVLINDSTKILDVRENVGKIKNTKQLLLTLQKNINQKLDLDKNTLITFYPGKDRCNSTGQTTKESRKVWDFLLSEKIKKIDKINNIKIYKSIFGLGDKHNISEWDKDPFQIIEKLFFKHHYSCGSFVFIGPNGNFISYFGETGHDKRIELLKKLLSI